MASLKFGLKGFALWSDAKKNYAYDEPFPKEGFPNEIQATKT